MSYGVGGEGGLVLYATSAVPSLEYDPVRGACEEGDGNVFFQILPDVLSMLNDKEQLTTIWSSYMQVVSDLLLQLLCVDASHSIVDVPLDYQRKYVHIEIFDRTEDFVTPPQLIYSGVGESQYEFNGATQTIDATWVTRLSPDRAYWSLTSGFDQRASPNWSWKATYTRLSSGCYGFVGYGLSSSPDLSNSLLVGVGNGGRIAVAQVSGSGQPNLFESIPFISEGNEVTIYVNIEDGMNVSVSADAYDPDTDSTTHLDFSVNLEDGTNPTTYVVDSFGFFNLDLRTPTPFDADSTVFSTIFESEVIAAVSSVTYDDPSIDPNIQEIPFLQDQWCSPNVLLTQTVEYALFGDTSPLEYRFIGFLYPALPTYLATLPPDPEFSQTFLLAEYVSWNARLVENNFGRSVKLSGPNTESYLRQVQALHFALWKGPTISNIRLGVQVLLGLPFVYEAGVVDTINPAASGVEGEIIIDSPSGLRAYRYSLDVSPVVSVGDEVDQFDPLTDGVKIQDWINSPAWFRPYLGTSAVTPPANHFDAALGFNANNPTTANTPTNELQKYHTYRVEIGAELFNIDLLVPIQGFLNDNRLKWKGVLVCVAKNILDDVSIEDSLAFEMMVPIEDHGGGSEVLNPEYDDSDGGVAPIYDHQYDLDSPPLIYDMFRLLFPKDPIEVVLENTSGGAVTITVNDVDVTINPGPGNAYTEDIP